MFVVFLLISICASINAAQYADDVQEKEECLSLCRRHDLEEGRMLFYTLQDNTAVIVVEKVLDVVQRQVFGFQVCSISDVGSDHESMSSQVVRFVMKNQKCVGGYTQVLVLDCFADTYVCSYSPLLQERVEPFFAHPKIIEQGKRCHMHLGRGLVMTSQGVCKEYDVDFYIYSCLYRASLDIVMKCEYGFLVEKEPIGQTVVYGHDVVDIPYVMPFLPDQKKQSVHNCSKSMTLTADGCDDVIVRMFCKPGGLGHDEYNLIDIATCSLQGQVQDQWFIKEHIFEENIGQIALFHHDTMLSTFRYVLINRCKDKRVENDPLSLLTIVLSEFSTGDSSLTSKVKCCLTIENNQGRPRINMHACCYPSPVKDGRNMVVVDRYSLPRLFIKNGRSVFLNCQRSLRSILGFPYKAQ